MAQACTSYGMAWAARTAAKSIMRLHTQRHKASHSTAWPVPLKLPLPCTRPGICSPHSCSIDVHNVREGPMAASGIK